MELREGRKLDREGEKLSKPLISAGNSHQTDVTEEL